MGTHAGAKLLRNRAALLDREIGNAAIGVELIGRQDRIGRTGFDATRASAATIRSGEIGFEIERCQDYAKKQPRASLLIDEAGVFSEPSNTRVFCKHAFDNRTGVDIAASFKWSVVSGGRFVQSCFNSL